MNFRNQRLGRHQAADYTIIMSRTLKVTGNHVMYDRGAWFLRVITSSSRALCLPSVKKEKHWLPGLLRWPSKTSKNSWRQGLTRHKKVDEGGKEGAVCWLREREKIWENLRYFYTFRNKLSVPITVVTIFFFVQCIIKQLLHSVFVISRIIKVFG